MNPCLFLLVHQNTWDMVGSTGTHMASFNSEFIGLDLEATDLTPERGGIIEIGAVRWKNGKEVAHYSTLIDPGHPIPPIITSITGIRGQDVVGKPSFDTVRGELRDFIGGAPIVGHNIAFDIGFLRSQGLPLDNASYDTWKIATLMLPKASSHSLEALAQDLKLNHPEAHRALHDARVGAELFIYLADRITELDATTAGRIATIIENNKSYSLAPFFAEVLGKIDAKETAKLVPGWLMNSKAKAAVKSRKPAKKVTPTVENFSKVFAEAVKPTVPAFEVRAPQTELAKLVLDKLDGSGTTIIEATTGLGRREAALVGLLSGDKKGPLGYAVVGHHQLETVLPAAEQIATYFGRSVTLLDQPSNYVFVPALERALGRTDLNESQAQLAIKLLIWIQATQTGLLKEVAITWEERSLMDEVSCSAHSCAAQTEPDLCSFCRAIKHAQGSDVVLLRHETVLWLSAKASKLLALKGLVIDDADQLENSVSKFFGVFVHQGRIERLLERIEEEGLNVDIQPVRNQLTLLAGLFGVFLDHQALEAEWSGYRTISISSALEKDPEFGRVQATINSLTQKLAGVEEQLGKQKSDAAQTLGRSLQEVIDDLLLFTKSVHQNGVMTLSLNAEQKLVLKFEPVTATEYVKEHVLAIKPLLLIGPRLTVEQKFEFVQQRLGLDNVESAIIHAPSRVQERTKVVTLSDHPESIERSWAKATAHVIATTAQTLHGRILVLFGGRGQVMTVHPEVEKLLAGTGIKLLAQGLSGGRGKTTKALARHEQAVLLTSHFFMQGRTFTHGFRGIVLVKLPFEVPDEAYKVRRAKDPGAGFMTYDLPRVALKVREQFDRLLVGPKDRGVLVIADPKINKGYGAVVLKSVASAPQSVVKTGDLPAELTPFAAPVDKSASKTARSKRS